MSFFGKIKSAVMGNPVTREYEVGKQVASAGPGLLWKVHQGVKKSTRQEASVFVFNKQAPEFEKMPKKQREEILDMLRRGPTHLVRLKHPRLVTIDHPLEESGNCLAFATEPIVISLANILGHYDNLPSPLPLSIKEYELHPIESQYGLLNIAEALQFLHSGVRLMHGNITPEAIVVTGNGTWKLMGFNFSCYSQYQSEAQTSFQFREWDSRRHIHTNPSLDYLAPEYILSQSCSEKSDVYSFGMLCYALYNGRPLCENANNVLSFKRNVETISRITENGLGQMPLGFRPIAREMLAIEPSVRPDALEITKHAFFEEVGVATLRYLDTLYEKGDMERSQYFKKDLSRVVTKLPKRVVLQRVLPALKEEFRNHKMVPFVLPIVLLIAEDCNMHEYNDVIMPILIPALKVQDPIQVPLIFLQKMDLLLKKTSPEDVRQHILPTIIASLETENGQLQGLCVSLIPSFATTIDYSSMKHSIVPRITAIMITANSVALRVKCLVTVAKMMDSLDKHIVVDHILPIMEQIPSREPGVLMAILGIYHEVLKNKKLGLDKMLLATKVLPFLLPLTVEPTLNVNQFNQFMMVIREMLKKLETEQQAHLEQLARMEEQTRSTVEFAREVSEAKAMENTINRFEETFGGGAQDQHMIPRRGTTSSQGSSGSAPQSLGTSDPTDMFAGLLSSEPSVTAAHKGTPPTSHPLTPSPLTTTHTKEFKTGPPPPLTHPSHKPTPSPTLPPSTARQPTISPQQPMQPSPATSQRPAEPTVHSTPLQHGGQSATHGLGHTPNLLGGSRTSTAESAKPISFGSAAVGPSGGYRPPVAMQPQKPQSNATMPTLETADIDFLTGRGGGGGGGGGLSSSQGSTGWSSTVRQQQPSQQMSTGGGSIYSGMQLGGASSTSTQPQMRPQGTSVFAGLDMDSTSASPYKQPSPLSQRTLAQGGLMSSATPTQGHMTGLTNQPSVQGSMSSPLIPTPASQGSGGGTQSSSMGWSSGIGGGLMGQQPGAMGSGQQMGWSSGVQSVNWSTQNQNIGSGAPQNRTGWSSGTELFGGQSSPAPPTAAGLLMQGGGSGGGGLLGQPLLPQSGGGYSAPVLQPAQQPQAPRPAPGDNPFADLSFLS